MLSNVYSKSFITGNAALLAQVTTILHKRLLPYLAKTFEEDEEDGEDGEEEQDPGVLDIDPLLNATTMDIVTGYIFGLRASSNLINSPEELDWWLDLYFSRQEENFWAQELPGLTEFAQKWLRYRLMPEQVDEANGEIEDWVMQMCEQAESQSMQEESTSENMPVVYAQLKRALAKAEGDKGSVVPAEVLASELLDHLAAGFETSAITLNCMIHELSQNIKIQRRLQQELATLSPRLTLASAPALPDPKAVDRLPWLHAILWETLRLHPAIPGPQPRFTPLQGCQLGPENKSYYVPGGVRVSASAGLLHLNEDVYEGATEWRPERWLDMEKLDEEKRKDMESRWFWAFGR